MKKILALSLLFMLATQSALANGPYSGGGPFNGNAPASSSGGSGSGVGTSTSGQLLQNQSGSVVGASAVPIGVGGVSPANRYPANTDDWTKAYFGDGSVDTVLLSTSATGCSGTPTLTFGAPNSGGATATGHLLMNSGTTVAAVIDTPGRGYTANPTVTVGNTTGCSVTPVVTAYFTPNGSLWVTPDNKVYKAYQADANNAAWVYFPTPQYPLDALTNSVTAAAVVAAGSGYVTNDTITIANGTVIKINASGGAITSIQSIQTAGVWPCYTTGTQSQVSTSGSGTGATFTVTVNTAVAAYGTRRMTVCYQTNKVADIIRASDSTVLTVGFVGDEIDVTAMKSFCAGTTCKWTKWYDQGGQGNDAVQATDGNRPIVDFGQSYAGLPLVFGAPGYMTIPAGAAYTATGSAVYSLNRTETYGIGQYTLSAGLTVTNSTFFSFISNGFFSNTTIPVVGTWAPEIVGGTQGSPVVYSVNDIEASNTFSTQAGSLTGGTIGNSSSAQIATSAFVIWPRTLAAADRANFRATMYRTFKMKPQERVNLILTGDSRTYGLNAGNQVNYAIQLEPMLKTPARIIDTGVSGSTMAALNTRFYTGTGDAIPAVQPHDPNNAWSVLWIGTNDISASTPDATIYSGITTYVATMHALGWKVAVLTEFSLGGANATGLNVLINGNAAGADLIIPMASDPAWANGAWESASIISGVHPTTLGYGFIASDVQQPLNLQWK